MFQNLRIQIRSEGFVSRELQTIAIQRNSGHIQVEKDDTLLDSVKRIREGEIFGIIGIINIAALNYLVVINDAAIVGKLN